MARIYELRQKEVINIRDGSRLGYICDVYVDVDCGRITHIIVPGPGRIFGVFGREQEYRIPWDCIQQIGDDLILVDVDTVRILVVCEE